MPGPGAAAAKSAEFGDDLKYPPKPKELGFDNWEEYTPEQQDTWKQWQADKRQIFSQRKEAGLLDDVQLLKEDPDVVWHGSPSGDLRGAKNGLHVGTYKAAEEALNSRIGIPADGQPWDGTREYGKTLLAGQKTLLKMDPQGFNATGANTGVPMEDYYPTGSAAFSDGSKVTMNAKPEIKPYKITGPMVNSPVDNLYADDQANARMSQQVTRGTAKRGYFYVNTGEDTNNVSAVVPNGKHLVPIPQPNKNTTP